MLNLCDLWATKKLCSYVILSSKNKNPVLMSSCLKKYKNEAKLSKSCYSLLATKITKNNEAKAEYRNLATRYSLLIV